MAITIPHIKYIESLVACKFSIDEIEDKLKEYNLAFDDKVKKATSVIIKTLREEKPEYFDPTNPDPVDPEWVEELEVEEMFCHFTNMPLPENKASVEGAFQLLNDPMMYRLITSMAIALINDEDIELIVNGKFNMEYTASDVKMFLKYFFNLENWTLRDRQRYVEKIEDPQLTRYYKIALKKDKNYLLWKLGAAPEQDFGQMMKDMLNDSYYNFKEQSDTKPELAQKWARIAVKIGDRIETYDKETKGGSSGQDFLASVDFKIKSIASDTKKKDESEEDAIEDSVPHIGDLQEDHPTLKSEEKESKEDNDE